MKKRYARILAATLSAAMVFTSAPTAAFATELSVSEDAVEAEGAAANKQEIDGKFPTAAYITYSNSAKATIVADDLVDATGTPVRTTYDKVDPTLVGLKNLKVGDKVNVDFVLDVSGDSVDSSTGTKDVDYNGIVGYDKNTCKITRSIPVTCIADEFDAIHGAIAASLPNSIVAEYGTGKVQLLDGEGDPVENWTIVSTLPAVKTTNTVAVSGTGIVTGGVKIATVDNYDSTKYDVVKFYKDLDNAAWAYENGKVTYVADVEIIPAEVDSRTIDWPTAFTTDVVVGADTAKLEFNKTSPYGKFAVDTFDTSSANATPANVTVKLTSNGNYVFAKEAYDEKLVDYDTSNHEWLISNAFKSAVSKKVIAESEYKPVLSKTEFTYGSTYQDVLDAIIASGYVNYVVKGYEATAGTKKLVLGGNTLTIRAKIVGSDNCLADGSDYKDYTVTVTVKKPEMKVELDTKSFGQKKGSGSSATVEATDETDLKASATELSSVVDVKYAWYTGEGTLLSDYADTATFDIPDNKVGVVTYLCKMKYSLKENATTAQKTLFADLYGTGEVASETITVTTSEGSFGSDSAIDTKVYGYAAFNVNVDFTVGSGFANPEQIVYLTDAKGAKKELANVMAGDTITATVPKGLNAGDYTITFEVTSSKTSDGKTVTDKAVFVKAFEIGKKEYVSTDIDDTSNNFIVLPEKNYVYGTKVTDVDLTAANEAIGKLGKFTLAKGNDEYLTVGSTSVKLVYTLSDEAYVNYTFANDAKTCDVTQNLTVDKAVLKVTPQTVTIKLGEKLPELNNNDIEITGIVAGDDVKDAAITAELKYAPGVENKIATVGKIEEAIRLTAKTGASNITSGTTTVLNGKYTVELVYGTVEVVSATAPTTPPTVAPTPAPVKQAVAAAPKAAKAKATVKVGKKYTLKLKYAAGKKATVKKVKWTSSKKSVATVSSKGKVTAKKAGKATIYARVYFKDGSMKKIKFTVTVK